MTHIDAAILNGIEWACRKFQLLTGRTNVWLAVQLTNVSIVVYFLWAGFVYAWAGGIAPRLFIALFCGGVLYALTQTIFKVSIEEYEKSVYGRVARGLRNPRRIRDAVLRISFLTLSIVLAYPMALAYVHLGVRLVVFMYVLILLTTILLYLLACDPLPPCAGKLKVWIRAAVPSRLAVSRTSGPD